MPGSTTSLIIDQVCLGIIDRAPAGWKTVRSDPPMGQWQLPIGHVRIPSASGVPPVKAAVTHSGVRHRNNKLRPICLTEPTSFVCHLFIAPVSIVLWGRASFKWQMGGTFEHVMWSCRTPYTYDHELCVHDACGETLCPGLYQHRKNKIAAALLVWAQGIKVGLHYGLSSQERSGFQ